VSTTSSLSAIRSVTKNSASSSKSTTTATPRWSLAQTIPSIRPSHIAPARSCWPAST